MLLCHIIPENTSVRNTFVCKYVGFSTCTFSILSLSTNYDIKYVVGEGGGGVGSGGLGGSPSHRIDLKCGARV